jgi:DsbE subfamily thiol:disulfide oxidoreductase
VGRRRAGACPHLGALVAALTLSSVAACGGGSGSRAAASVGEPAPLFSSFDLNGRPVELADYRGKVVLLNFWASWCAPCRQEFPRLAALHGSGDVQVLGVLFEDTRAAARRFVREHGSTWPSVVDPAGQIADAYGVGKKPGIPLTWVIDGDGRARARHIGLLTEADLARLLTPT